MKLKEPSAGDMYLLLQEMHTDMRSFESRLDRVEKRQSNDNTETNKEVVSDQKLAPKHGDRRTRMLIDELSDDLF